MKKKLVGITAVPGIRVGHAQDELALTGCSVLLCPPGSIGGVDQRGGAPGTRETDLLKPVHLVNEIHAILLAGGSAFGLDAAAGVMQFLEENEIGYHTGFAKIPIVSAAVIYDLDIGDAKIRPDARMGYQACQNATAEEVLQGNVGAGTGARVGNIFGSFYATKSGIGTSAVEIQPGLFVGALMVVNAYGDVLDIKSGEILAGARSKRPFEKKMGRDSYFADTLETMRTKVGSSNLKFATGKNTVIGIVATNAKLNKEEINKVAQMAQDGIGRVIQPAHTMLDGDTLFGIATNQKIADVNLIGGFASRMCAQAINNAVLFAKASGGLPSANDFNN